MLHGLVIAIKTSTFITLAYGELEKITMLHLRGIAPAEYGGGTSSDIP